MNAAAAPCAKTVAQAVGRAIGAEPEERAVTRSAIENRGAVQETVAKLKQGGVRLGAVATFASTEAVNHDRRPRAIRAGDLVDPAATIRTAARGGAVERAVAPLDEGGF